MSLGLALYHRLPAGVRSIGATLYGMRLRWWRYGRDSARLAAAALERDAWSGEQWAAWRDERLAYVLERAATRVPYYREQWAERRRRGDRAAIDLLESWPVLEKETVRANAEAFVADDRNPRRMYHEQTSGTTGKPLHIWRRRETVSALYALSVARTRAWHGLTRDDRWAMLGGQLVVPTAQRRPPFWVWNAALRQLYLSSYHLAPDLVPYYLDALARYRVTYAVGYTSSLLALAQEALRSRRTDLRLRVALTSAEPVTALERETIAAAFHGPVRETYGMGETVAGGSECEHGTLHQWPEVGLIEVFQDGAPVPAGDSGELVCTGLLNEDMPFVRYRVGDSGRLAPDGPPCACGRALPAIGAIEGRTNDVLITRDGRRIAWVNPVFYGLPVRQGQIVQESLERVRVRYAPAADFTPAHAAAITERLHERLGDIAVVLEPVVEIPRGANGKFRAVVCAVPPEERAAALRPRQRAVPA